MGLISWFKERSRLAPIRDFIQTIDGPKDVMLETYGEHYHTKLIASHLLESRQFSTMVTIAMEAEKQPFFTQRLIRSCDDSDVASQLIQLYRTSPRFETQYRAAESLGPLGGEKAASAFCTRLPDLGKWGEYDDDGEHRESTDVLRATAEALGRIAWNGAIGPLTSAFENNRGYPKLCLAAALKRSGSDYAFQWIVDCVESQDADYESEFGVSAKDCAAVLAELGDTQAMPVLRKHYDGLSSYDRGFEGGKTVARFLEEHA